MAEDVPAPLKRHSTLNRRTITSIVNSEEDAAAPELIEAAREIEAVAEEEGPVAALVRRVTEQIQEAVEAKTEASQASATESEAPVRRKTELSLNFPGYAPYPYYYAPPPPPHGYWAPPHAPMTVPQGAYYPGASAPTASSASVSSSASQTE